jgi:hypothetical protein
LPVQAWAGDGQPHARFDRLDADKDGFVTADQMEVLWQERQ